MPRIKNLFLVFLLYLSNIITLGVSNEETTSQEYIHADVELTIYVKPGTQECFYQNAKVGSHIEIEYQVLDTAKGPGFAQEMDINFLMFSPAGHILATDHKKTDMLHRVVASETGAYKVCFDNTFSRFAQKTVYFELLIDDEDGKDNGGWDDSFDVPTDPTDPKDDEYSVMLDLLARVHESLRKVRHFQDIKKAIEARHRNIQELNFSRVNNFSIVAIVVILVVGAVQVVMLKGLFDNKSMVHQILSRLS